MIIVIPHNYVEFYGLKSFGKSFSINHWKMNRTRIEVKLEMM